MTPRPRFFGWQLVWRTEHSGASVFYLFWLPIRERPFTARF